MNNSLGSILGPNCHTRTVETFRFFFPRKEFYIFFSILRNIFTYLCKFGYKFTQRSGFSRALIKIFSCTGTNFHGRETVFFPAKEPFFHVKKKNTVEVCFGVCEKKEVSFFTFFGTELVFSKKLLTNITNIAK